VVDAAGPASARTLLIQVTLGRARAVDPALDPLRRSRLGWSPGLSHDELYGVARGTWTLGERVRRERFVVVCADGLVWQAIEIERIVDTPDGRRAFEGRVLHRGHEVHDTYVGGPAPNGRQRNPITFFDSAFDRRLCACGCGNPVGRGDFMSGHDSRAVHERVARVGSVVAFLEWFDRTWTPDQPGERQP
jgi:hypothetical protein